MNNIIFVDDVNNFICQDDNNSTNLNFEDILALLEDEYPLIVKPKLACKIGLNEAIVLQQIKYWTRPQFNKNLRDGRNWVHKTIDEWKADFPFWSYRTIQRTILSLEKQKLILTSNYNVNPLDRTKWHSVNTSLEVVTSCQIGTKRSCQNGIMTNKRLQETTLNNINNTNTKNWGVVAEIFECWKEVWNHPKAKLDSKRKQIISKALQNYSIDELKQAILGCSYTPHNKGENERGEVYDGIHIIFKDSDQIERFIRNCATKPSPMPKISSDRLKSGLNVIQQLIVDSKKEREERDKNIFENTMLILEQKE